jgi:hypothetical protein
MSRHRAPSAQAAFDAVHAAGTARHRKPSPGARHLTAIVLASAVAGGAVTTGVALSAAPGHPSRPDADDRAPAPPAAPVPPATPEPATAEAAPTAAPSPVAVTPAPASVPDRPVWRADGPGAFRATPWNTVGTTPPRAEGDVLRFAVTGPHQRSELEPAVPEMREGDEYWFAFSVRLDDRFPAGGSSRQVITQWKNDSPGTAPLDLRVRDHRLVLHGGYGHPSGPRTFDRELGPAPVEEWSHVVVRIRFSADPDQGSVSVWQDGDEEVRAFHPPGGTLYPGQTSYLKTGLSRDPMITRPAGVDFRGWVVGPNHASVA